MRFSSVQFSHSVMSDSLRPHEPQHARPPCPSPTPGVHPNPCPLSRWCHPTISSSVAPFSCPQSFPASGSFQMSQLFASGGHSIGVSASTSVLPMNVSPSTEWSIKNKYWNSEGRTVGLNQSNSMTITVKMTQFMVCCTLCLFSRMKRASWDEGKSQNCQVPLRSLVRGEFKSSFGISDMQRLGDCSKQLSDVWMQKLEWRGLIIKRSVSANKTFKESLWGGGKTADKEEDGAEKFLLLDDRKRSI